MHRSANPKSCLRGYATMCCTLHDKIESYFHLKKTRVTNGSVFPQFKKLEQLFEDF